MQTTTVTTADGSTLHSESFGDPSSEPILLIMGATASGHWWPDDFCRILAGRGLFVIRYDHRDTGESRSYPAGEPGYSLADLAGDAISVLDAYGVRQAHVAGMSMGGWLAQMLALTRPERVRTLTLIASEPLASPDSDVPQMDPAVIEYHSAGSGIDWTDRESVVAFQTGLWRLLSGRGRTFDREAAAAIAGGDFDRADNPVSMFNHAMIGGDPAEYDQLIDRLGEIGIPALVVHGTHDRVLPYEHALRLARLLPRAQLLTLEGAGHELNRQAWPGIADAIETLIRDCVRSSPVES